MVAPEGLQAAREGRESRARYAETEVFNEESFVAADLAALAGAWESLGRDAGQAGSATPDGLIDDDLAFASPWGFDVGEIVPPVLLVQGGLDRVVPASHGDWLLRHCPSSELWLRPRDGHISVLEACPVGMDWLLGVAGLR
jgi:pimeloyl-ACP methyl ester carboxylesterase